MSPGQNLIQLQAHSHIALLLRKLWTSKLGFSERCKICLLYAKLSKNGFCQWHLEVAFPLRHMSSEGGGWESRNLAVILTLSSIQYWKKLCLSSQSLFFFFLRLQIHVCSMSPLHLFIYLLYFLSSYFPFIILNNNFWTTIHFSKCLYVWSPFKLSFLLFNRVIEVLFLGLPFVALWNI